MPLFICSNCSNIENTAAQGADFFGRTLLEACEGKKAGECSQCSRCATGEWHGQFSERKHDPSAPIGSESNPEDLWVGSDVINKTPRRTGHRDGWGKWVWDDGFGDQRPYYWVDGVAVFDDELSDR